MKSLCGLFFGMLMASVCHAAEIVAWKMPLSRYVQDELKTQGVVRCKAPPETSPFFKEGDELWDLKNAKPYLPNDQKLSLDWMVWDVTSERLVAKADWSNICAIHEILRTNDVPRHLKLRVEIYEVSADAAPLAENAKPVSELSIRVRSGQNSTAKWSGNGSSLEVDTGVWLGDTDSFADVRLVVNAGVPDQPRLQVNTAFTLKAGSPLWVARDFNGTQGLDLQVSGTLESLDGIPLREVVMIQEENTTRSLWPQSRSHEYESVPVGSNGWLMSCSMSPELLKGFINGSGESNEKDPFAEHAEQAKTELPKTASVKPPALISSSLNHEVLDATEWLRKEVLNPGGNLDLNGSFAGYDPIGQRLYFYSPNRETVDMALQCMMPMCNLQAVSVGVTLDGVGQTRLIGKSGQKALLKRVKGEETIQRSLEIEPTIGESEDLMDLHFMFENRADANKITEINSSNILTVGKTLEVFSGEAADGQTQSLRLRGELLRISPGEGE